MRPPRPSLSPLAWAQRIAPAFVRSLTPTRTAPSAAGVAELTLGEGPHALAATLWYPAQGSDRGIAYGRMYRGMAHANAPLAQGEPRPLVLMSHGLRANRYDLSWLGERLAAAGWMSLAIDHPRSTAADFDPYAAMRLWERAQTLTSALDHLLADAAWGPAVDRRRIVAAGHSAGGSTLLLLGGARLDKEGFTRYFPKSCTEGMGEPCADARVRALLLLAPGTGPAFKPEGLRTLRLPVLLVSGTDDLETPDAWCAEHYARHLPRCQWQHIEHGGHFVFKPECQSYACLRSPALCADHQSVNRRAVHNALGAQALTFFDEHTRE